MERKEQIATYLFCGKDTQNITIQNEYIVVKFNVKKTHNIVFGRDTRLCVEQFLSNFTDAALILINVFFEMYSPTILYDDICYSSTNNDLVPLLGVYNNVTNTYHHEVVTSYPANNLFSSGIFTIKFRFRDENLDNVIYQNLANFEVFLFY